MSSKKITKLNEYFYMTSGGDILKYKKYCIINDCKKLSSYNYYGKKELLYCNDHKLDKMVNIKKGYILCDKHNISYLKFCKECEQMDCLLCDETVNKNHFFFQRNILIILIKTLLLKQELLLKRNSLILYLIFI